MKLPGPGAGCAMALPLAVALAPAAHATSCETIAPTAFDLGGGATVVSARGTEVASGSLLPPGTTTPITGLPRFCRVQITASSNGNPAQSLVSIEAWLPGQGWNGRFIGTGNGGFGATSQPLPPAPLDRQDDALGALKAWVEHGLPPTRITATKYVNDTQADGIAFQRPLCQYPLHAAYRGGDRTQASSFVCAPSLPVLDQMADPHWGD